MPKSVINGLGPVLISSRDQTMEWFLQVLHMFRRGANDKNMIFKSLPQKMYPEYHRIHQMMARGREHEADYQPLERQHIIEIFEVMQVT